MRRLALLAGALLALGLTTAVAASFTVQAEDITSFSTPVSISVPDPPTASATFALRHSASTIPGLLAPDLSNSGDGVHSRVIGPGVHHSWETLDLAVDLVLDGPATLWIEKNQPTRPITAQLFSCPGGDDAPAPLSACSPLAPAVSVAHSGDGGIVEREVPLGHITGTVIATNRLRLHITNLNSQNFTIQWGYRDNRQARLDVTLAGP